MKLFLFLTLIGLAYGHGLLGGLLDKLFPQPRSPLDDNYRKLSPNPSNPLNPSPRRDSNPTTPPSKDDKPLPSIPLNETDCGCRLGTSSRIVNGQITKPNSIPWQVSLATKSGSHFCGATVINAEYILTAAHCVNGKKASDIKARLGLHYLDDPEIETKTYEVEKIFQHYYTSPSEAGRLNAHETCKKKKKKKFKKFFKRSISTQSELNDTDLPEPDLTQSDFDEPDFDESDSNQTDSPQFDLDESKQSDPTDPVSGDIAVLKLKKPIEFAKGKVEPACFNTVAKEYNDKLMASGWGTTSVSVKDSRGNLKTGKLSPILKQAYFREFREGCEKYLICIDSDNRDSVCQGDSGGPIHETNNGKTTVEGIASFVTGESSQFGGSVVEMCTGEGAYARLSSYKKWFENIVGSNYCTAN